MQTIPFNNDIEFALIASVEHGSGNDPLNKLSQEALTVNMPDDIVNNFSSNYGSVVTAQDTVAVVKDLPRRHYVDIGNRRFDNVDTINSLYFLYLLSSGYCSFGCAAVSPFSATAKSMYRFNSDLSFTLTQSNESPQDSPIENYAINLNSVNIEQTSVVEERANINLIPCCILLNTTIVGSILEFKTFNDRYAVVHVNGNELRVSYISFDGTIQETVDLPVTYNSALSTWAEVNECYLGVAHANRVFVLSDRGELLRQENIGEACGFVTGEDYGRTGFYVANKITASSGNLTFVTAGFSAVVDMSLDKAATALVRTESEVIVGYSNPANTFITIVALTTSQSEVRESFDTGIANEYLAGLTIINSELVGVITTPTSVINYRFNSPANTNTVTALNSFQVETSAKMLRSGAGVFCFFPNPLATNCIEIEDNTNNYCDEDTGDTQLADTVYSLHRTLGEEFIDDTGFNVTNLGTEISGMAVDRGLLIGMDSTMMFMFQPKFRSQRLFPFTRTLRINTRVPYPVKFVERQA